MRRELLQLHIFLHGLHRCQLRRVSSKLLRPHLSVLPQGNDVQQPRHVRHKRILRLRCWILISFVCGLPARPFRSQLHALQQHFHLRRPWTLRQRRGVFVRSRVHGTGVRDLRRGLLWSQLQILFLLGRREVRRKRHMLVLPRPPSGVKQHVHRYR